VKGNSLFRGTAIAYNAITAPSFTATSTSASSFTYASSVVSAIANGANGQVLKISGGVPTWGTDLTGGGADDPPKAAHYGAASSVRDAFRIQVARHGRPECLTPLRSTFSPSKSTPLRGRYFPSLG
jgi:hypothetical protein